MTQKNQKFGERKSDLVCSCCERELEWRGNVMEGKMVCTTSWCVKNDDHQVAGTVIGSSKHTAWSMIETDKISGDSDG